MATTMEEAMFIMFNMHACACTHACMPSPNPHPQSRGTLPQISKMQ